MPDARQITVYPSVVKALIIITLCLISVLISSIAVFSKYGAHKNTVQGILFVCIFFSSSWGAIWFISLLVRHRPFLLIDSTGAHCWTQRHGEQFLPWKAIDAFVAIENSGGRGPSQHLVSVIARKPNTMKFLVNEALLPVPATELVWQIAQRFPEQIERCAIRLSPSPQALKLLSEKTSYPWNWHASEITRGIIWGIFLGSLVWLYRLSLPTLFGITDTQAQDRVLAMSVIIFAFAVPPVLGAYLAYRSRGNFVPGFVGGTIFNWLALLISTPHSDTAGIIGYLLLAVWASSFFSWLGGFFTREIYLDHSLEKDLGVNLIKLLRDSWQQFRQRSRSR